MWNPPIALSPEEQKIAARTQKARKFFVFLRTIRHELLDADFQQTLAKSYSPEPGGKAPVDAGLLALATLLQAYCHVGDRDAVELTVMDKRWQLVLDCLGAEHPPFSQGTLVNFRMRLIAHNLDKALLDRTVALAEHTGGFGARQLRAVLDSTPLFGAGRVEDTLNLLGHALRKAADLAAQELGTCATVAKAVPKPSTAFKSTLPWMWIAQSPGRWWSAQRMSRSMRRSSCWPRSWSKPPACCSSISTWGTWPAPGLPNGRSRVCTLSPAPGRKLVRFSPSKRSSWTLQLGR